MEDRTVIPWDKDDIEALGFFKVDVLGLGMLTASASAWRRSTMTAHFMKHQVCQMRRSSTRSRCCEESGRRSRGVRLASQADTVGIFQIESRAQMAMLPRLALSVSTISS